MPPLYTRFGETTSILLIVPGIMFVAAAGMGLIMVALELVSVVVSVVPFWWGKLLSFILTLMIVYGVALLAGLYLVENELRPY